MPIAVVNRRRFNQQVQWTIEYDENSSYSSPSPLDGASIPGTVWIRGVPGDLGGRTLGWTHPVTGQDYTVAWLIDGSLFRDDDINSPYTMRPGSVSSDINTWGGNGSPSVSLVAYYSDGTTSTHTVNFTTEVSTVAAATATAHNASASNFTAGMAAAGVAAATATAHNASASNFTAGMAAAGVAAATATAHNASEGTAGFTHGDDVFRWNVGRADGFYVEDVRTPLAAATVYSGTTTFGAAQANSTWDNYQFNSNITIGADASNVTFRNCHFAPPTTTTGGQYGFRLRDGGTAIVEDSTFVCSHYDGKTIYVQSGGVYLKRCLILGGEDAIHSTASQQPPSFPDYEAPDFTGANLIVEECFISDTTRLPAGHTDLIQVDGNASNVVVIRSKLMAYYLNEPNKPRTSEAAPAASGNASFIATYGASTTQQLHDLGVYDCRVNGGNFIVYMYAPDGPEVINGNVRGCHFGAEEAFTEQSQSVVCSYRFGLVRSVASTGLSNNTYALTGKAWKIGTNTFFDVTAGQAI